ncbi:MAG TPA: single-stranded DNA-binding protein [Puia sp.]|nr:single-stranded DNA-binding protein [Puia sp.]
MKSYNKVQLVGYLGTNPELTEFGQGEVMARFRMATHTWHRPDEGEAKQNTTWHTIKIWGRERAEILCQYAVKGSHVLVEGRIVYSNYKSPEGIEKYSAEIYAHLMINLDR